MNVSAIIVSAGKAERMKGLDKQFLNLGGKPAIAHVLDTFLACIEIAPIVLVVPRERIDDYEKWLSDYYGFYKDIKVVAGGTERQYSVFNGLSVLPVDTDIVVIHDGARPFVTQDIIYNGLEIGLKYGAAIPGIPVKDTIKQVDERGDVSITLDRKTLWAIQTPQIFKYELIMQAHMLAAKEGYVGTDDAALVEHMGGDVKVFMGDYSNIKITTPEDVAVAEILLNEQKCSLDKLLVNCRVGIGYDVHRLAADRELVLGGVRIPYSYGLLGHSDADVLLHALIDAILGAMACGDIGKHFPDNDDSYRGISSMELLREVMEIAKARNYIINNVDVTLLAEKPKMAPYVWHMRRNIASVLGISVNSINIKATTNEGLGFIGRNEGIAAHATAMLYKR